MPAIYPISTGRVSELLVQKRLLSQFEFDNLELVKLQDQLSTGLRLSRPSDDAPAAMRAITLQRLLEQKEQAKTNLQTSQSYIGATDNALGGVSELLTNIRAEALGVVDTTSSRGQREAVATEVRRAVERLSSVGNQQFRGRFLFAGSTTTVRPFELTDNHVVYHGNERSLQSFVDIDYLSDTNINGNQVFGAISAEVRGSSDLNPVLTSRSRLSDLRGGLGISKGSFVLSDSTSTSTVDIGTAETIGDVIRLIEDNPPEGRQIVVRSSASGLILDLDDAGGGSLTVREVVGGTTAAELGILQTNGNGAFPLVGNDLNPRLLATTPLANLLGTRATAVLESLNSNNDIFIEAVENGAALSDIAIRFVANNAAGDEAIVTFDEANKTLDIDITPATTTAATVVNAINASGVFIASLDSKLDSNNDGSGAVDFTATATTSDGSGIVFDRESGIQIVNGDETFTITFDQAETVEDVLNILNTSKANLLAEISADGRGLDVRTRLSGADLKIGENGGTTAGELGIRSYNLETRLNDLNYGHGVDTADGADFVIQRKDGVELEIDISDATTISDVIDRINNHVDNTGAAVQARLAVQGNGLELIDANTTGTETLTIRRAESFAAWDLGFVPRPGDEATASLATAATASLQFAPQNTAIQITANQTGFALDGVVIEFQDTLTGNQASAAFDSQAKRLTIQIDANQTSANTVITELIANTPFSAALDTTIDPTNDGTGIPGATGEVATTAGGAPELLRGDDANPIEVKGIFNSLLRLNEALINFDLNAVERAVGMLDDDFSRLTYSRAEVGARARNFDALERRLENEEVDMRSTLSLEIDADLVEAISNLTARQANMEATLRLIGQSLQLTVLSFL